MANRTGTYVAFDGLGQTDPSKSDFKHYAIIQAWSANKNIDFKLTNSHEKASSVRDSSKRATLEASIRTRLSASKNMLVVLSRDTRKSGSILSYEIEKAVDLYELPLIIAYVGESAVLNPSAMRSYWPESLKIRIDNSTAKAIHIGFKKDCLIPSISRFSVNGEQLTSSSHYFSEQTYKDWGIL